MDALPFACQAMSDNDQPASWSDSGPAMERKTDMHMHMHTSDLIL